MDGWGRKWLPLALASAALLIALSGVSMADAASAVKRALNADKINGIKASKLPKAGQLVPLGKDGKFPASVLPAAAQGARGPRGEQGPVGPAGSTGAVGAAGISTGYDAVGPSVNLSKVINQRVSVASLKNVPAGSWVILWSVSLDYFNNEIPPDIFCAPKANGNELDGLDLAVGGTGAAWAQIMSSSTSTSQAHAFDIDLVCWSTINTAQNVHADGGHLTLLRVDDLKRSTATP